jgi:chaperonin GroEL
MEESARWIAKNAGADRSVVPEKIKISNGTFGYNAAKEEFEDMLQAG